MDTVAKYIYTIQQDGKKLSGSLEAPDRNAALRKLAGDNTVITRLTTISEKKENLRVSGDDLLMFTQELASMLHAGISLKKALDILASDVDNPSLRQVVMEISANLGEGSAISSVMDQYPKVFPRIYVAMVKAGEASGDLALILKRIAKYIENLESLKQKVKAQLYYPGMVLAFSFVVMAFLMIFGIPRITEIYEGLNTDLPALTQTLIGVGRFLDNYWYVLLFLLGAGAYMTWRWSLTPTGIRFFDKVKLRAVLFGPIFKKIGIARFARSLSTLYSSGVPLLEAMELVAGSLGNVIMEQAVRSSIEKLNEGESISQSLVEHHTLFTPMALSMMAVGEETGSLSDILDELAAFYEDRVEIALRGLTSLIEPLVMIVVGIFIGILIVSLALPFLTLFATMT
jgi:type IV pilus assembly protein PilC